jgi:hypothetical protein
MCDLMLGDLEAQRRQLVHLAPLHPAPRLRRQRRVAGAASRWPMRDDDVGLRYQAQVVPAMARLASRFLPALLAQALRLAGEPVARRRLRAIEAVLGQPPLQLLYARHQHLQLLAQRGVLGFQGGVLVLQLLARHGLSLPTPAILPKQLQLMQPYDVIIGLPFAAVGILDILIGFGVHLLDRTDVAGGLITKSNIFGLSLATPFPAVVHALLGVTSLNRGLKGGK